MNIIKTSFFFALISYCPFSLSQTITDKIMLSVLEKHLPDRLYEHQDKTWQMGRYSLSVDKVGTSKLTSDAKQLNVAMPLALKINATVNKTILGNSIMFKCHSTIKTEGVIHIAPVMAAIPPATKSTKTKVKSATANVIIDIPTPTSFLNCEGFKLPIKPILDQLINEKKSQWENQIEGKINQAFKEIGI